MHYKQWFHLMKYKEMYWNPGIFLIRVFRTEGIYMHGYDCLMHDMLVWDYGKKSYEYIRISENLLHQSYMIIYGIPSGSWLAHNICLQDFSSQNKYVHKPSSITLVQYTDWLPSIASTLWSIASTIYMIHLQHPIHAIHHLLCIAITNNQCWRRKHSCIQLCYVWEM